MPKILAYPIVDATRILPSNFDKENEKVYKRKLQHDFTIKGQNKKQRTVEVQLKQKTLFIKKVTDGVPFKLVATHPALEPAHDAMVATDNLLKYGCSALAPGLAARTSCDTRSIYLSGWLNFVVFITSTASLRSEDCLA